MSLLSRLVRWLLEPDTALDLDAVLAYIAEEVAGELDAADAAAEITES